MSFLLLSPTHIDSVPPPGVTVTDVTSSQVVYETTAHGSATRVIAGYEVFRFKFGVPMVGEYVNTSGGMNVTISPAVPGAQYRITAWAFGNGSRSATPTVKSVTTGEASEFYIHSVVLVYKWFDHGLDSREQQYYSATQPYRTIGQ